MPTVVGAGLLALPLVVSMSLAQVVLLALALQLAAALVAAVVDDRQARTPLLGSVLAAQVWALAWGSAAAELTLQALLASAAIVALGLVVARQRQDRPVAVGAMGWLGVGLPAVAGLGAVASDLPPATGWAIAAVVGAVVGLVAQLLLDPDGQGTALDRATARVAEAVSAVVHASAIVATATARASDALAIVLAAGTVALLLHGTRPDRRGLHLAAGAEGLALTWLLLARADVGLVEAYTLPLAVLLLGIGGLAPRARGIGPVPSWWAVGPGLVAGLGPTVVLGAIDGGPVRPLVGIVAGAALLVAGAVRGRRAPFDIGASSVAVLGLTQAAPMVGSLPSWTTIGATGVGLLAVGATFEQRRADLRTARRRYSSLT